MRLNTSSPLKASTSQKSLSPIQFGANIKTYMGVPYDLDDPIERKNYEDIIAEDEDRGHVGIKNPNLIWKIVQFPLKVWNWLWGNK